MMNTKRTLVILSQYIPNVNNAGPKAKKDIETILSKDYNAEIKTLINSGKENDNLIYNFAYKIKKFIFYYSSLTNDAIYIIQHPFINDLSFLQRIKHKIVIIHDIVGLREHNDYILNKEINAFKEYDYVIVHNDIMEDFLIKHGVMKSKIYKIYLFDYLTGRFAKNTQSESLSIAYIGNPIKSEFLGSLSDISYNLNLYGNFPDYHNSKMHTMGVYNPDLLPEAMNEKLGLIWDGKSDESDRNENYKDYSRYNNPHKLSCYLAAEMPVISWQESAIANLIIKENIGYLIKDLRDISTLDLSDYQNKKISVIKLKNKITEGYYTKNVIDKVLSNFSDNDYCYK